jgi:hypothetical protein
MSLNRCDLLPCTSNCSPACFTGCMPSRNNIAGRIPLVRLKVLSRVSCHYSHSLTHTHTHTTHTHHTHHTPHTTHTTHHTHTCVHLKYPFNFFERFSNNIQIPNFTKTRPVRAEIFDTDGRTDRHYEADNLLSLNFWTPTQIISKIWTVYKAVTFWRSVCYQLTLTLSPDPSQLPATPQHSTSNTPSSKPARQTLHTFDSEETTRHSRVG